MTTENSTRTESLSNGNDKILIIDPLIEPLIVTNEFNETTEPHDKLYRFGSKCESILTLNATKQDQTATSSTCLQIARRCTGIFYAIIGSCLFTCSGFLIKQLRVNFFDALLVRFILQTSIIFAFIFYKKMKFIHGTPSLICLQIARTIIACSGLLLFYASYLYIPLPDLTTCRYTQVIWTAILAMIVFRERISIAIVLAIILTLTGVVFVAQPTFLFPPVVNQTKISNDLESNPSYHILGLCLALACALSISFSMVFNKKLIVSKIPQSIIMLEFSLLNLCLLLGYHFYNRFVLLKYANQTMFTWQYFLAASISLIQVLSSTINQCAMKLEHPSIISVAQSSDMIFAIGLQNLFTNVKSNRFVLIGSFLVTLSIVIVGIHKFWKDQKKQRQT